MNHFKESLERQNLIHSTSTGFEFWISLQLTMLPRILVFDHVLDKPSMFDLLISCVSSNNFLSITRELWPSFYAVDICSVVNFDKKLGLKFNGPHPFTFYGFY